jgi:hypothetical protein
MRPIGTLEVEHQSLIVIHEPRTGRVLHMHYVETMKGGRHPDRATMERDAQEQLSQRQPGNTSKLAFLHADPDSVEPRKVYKVDTKKGLLAEVKTRQASPRGKE